MMKVVMLSLLVAASFAAYHPHVINILPPMAPLQVQTIIRHNSTILHSHKSTIAYSQDQQTIEVPAELALPEEMAVNLTIQVVLYAVDELTEDRRQLVRQERNLTRYQRVRIQGQDGSLVSHDPMDQIAVISKEQQKSQHQEQTTYEMHIPRQFDIMVIVCHMPFRSPHSIKPQHRLTTTLKGNSYVYMPPLDLGQLYIPTTRSVPIINNSSHIISLRLFTRSYYNFLTFYSFGHVEEFQKSLGPLAQVMDVKEELMDQMKQFLFQNPLWLVVLYFVLSFSETILKLAFVKSQLTFWKNIAHNKGISLKTLFFQLFADIFISLYLYQYGANTLVIVFHMVDVAITLWKITRTYSIVFQGRFPFVKLQPSQAYLDRAAIDSESIWYMNYLLVPLMGMYLVYAFYKRNWVVVNYYRFCLQTGVAFIALFGFILMTPQLYLNYKLKSVDHMNWRGMIYRFITTIIDDLFAFMVTMPALRRVMYFRDDLIFLGYCYQRYIYRVDYSRKTLFTQHQSEKHQPLKQD